jgi:hypothetical protein
MQEIIKTKISECMRGVEGVGTVEEGRGECRRKECMERVKRK